MSPRNIAKKIIGDPGISFTMADVFFFFSSTTFIGFYACIFALITSITLKYFSLNRKTGAKKLFIFDPRLSLWLISIVLFIVSVDSLLYTHFMAALTGSFFAIANIRVAESITKEEKTESHSIISLIIKRPDLYASIGTIFFCLSAGTETLVLLPIIFISLYISIKNSWKKLPEHNMHPKLLLALVSVFSIAIGIYNQNFSVATAHIITALAYVSIESHITPGGLRQVIKNVKKLISA